jgi:Ca-activated chloride channel homolog
MPDRVCKQRLVKSVLQILVIIVCAWAAGARLAAQSSGLRSATSPGVSGQNPADTFTLHTRVNLVVLHATVLDRNGHHVEGLQKNDFQVYENGAPQKLAVFSHADVPVTMGILIDDSGSMRIVRPAVNAAAWSFVKTSNPADQVFVVTFNQTYDFDLPGPFAANLRQLKTALNHHIESRGGTALYDAVYASLEHLDFGTHDNKKVLLVITDGDDNSSAHTLSQLMWFEEQSDAQVYMVGLLAGGGYLPGEDYEANIMRKMADATGGKAFLPTSLTQVNQVCEHIARLIRDQYTLGYYPTNVTRDGSFRRVKVVALEPNTDEPLIVKTRSGYYAPEGNPFEASSAPTGTTGFAQTRELSASN